MMFGDPGPCPVCGAPHTTCTAPTAAIVVAQLPERDAAPHAPMAPPGPTEPARPPGQFTTATYRRKGRRP